MSLYQIDIEISSDLRSDGIVGVLVDVVVVNGSNKIKEKCDK